MPARPIDNELVEGEIVKLTFICPFCKGHSSINVNHRKWLSWFEGNGYVQNVFPELTPGERETLINGCHEACFDKAFG